MDKTQGYLYPVMERSPPNLNDGSIIITGKYLVLLDFDETLKKLAEDLLSQNYTIQCILIKDIMTEEPRTFPYGVQYS
jgi:hypothetical protein